MTIEEVKALKVGDLGKIPIGKKLVETIEIVIREWGGKMNIKMPRTNSMAHRSPSRPVQL